MPGGKPYRTVDGSEIRREKHRLDGAKTRRKWRDRLPSSTGDRRISEAQPFWTLKYRSDTGRLYRSLWFEYFLNGYDTKKKFTLTYTKKTIDNIYIYLYIKM